MKPLEQAILILTFATFSLFVSGCANPIFETSKNNILDSVADNDESLEILFGVGRLAERNGRSDKAIEAYTAILDKRPEHTASLHRMGVIEAKRGSLENAMAFFDKAARNESANAELLGDIGYVHYLMGDLDAAENSLRAAIEENPEDERLLNNLGIVAGSKQHYARAMELFRQSLSEAEALASVAFLQSQTGQVDEAEENFARALKLDSRLDIAATGLIELNRNQQPPASDSDTTLPLNLSSPVRLASHDDVIETREPARPQTAEQKTGIFSRLRGPQSVVVGNEQQFELQIENRSATAAQNISVSLTLSPEMDVTVMDREADFDGANRRIVWRIPAIAAGATEVLTYAAKGRLEGSATQQITIRENNRPVGNLKLVTRVSP